MHDIDPENLEKFRELVRSEEYDALEYWTPRLCPHIKGMARARKSCLVSLASGRDGSIRRRVHTLLVGPPGTGKSKLRNWIKRELGAVGAGPKSTEAGLKYNASTGEPGALKLAHEGVLVIDELDKLKDTDPLLESLEEGVYEVHSGDYHLSIEAECRVIACCNKAEALDPVLLDRFDLVVPVEIGGRKEEKEVTDHIYDSYFNGIDSTGHELRDYLKWIEPYEPEIPNKIREEIKELKNNYIDSVPKWEPDVRQKEGFLRIAESIARLNRRDVTVGDYERAIELQDPEYGDWRSREFIYKGEAQKTL